MPTIKPIKPTVKRGMRLALARSLPKGGYWYILRRTFTGKWVHLYEVGWERFQYKTSEYTEEDMVTLIRGMLQAGNVCDDPFGEIKEITL